MFVNNVNMLHIKNVFTIENYKENTNQIRNLRKLLKMLNMRENYKKQI